MIVLLSVNGRITPKTWQTVLAACTASCSALMRGCKGTVQARCCYWLVQHSLRKQPRGPQSKRKWRPLLFCPCLDSPSTYF